MTKHEAYEVNDYARLWAKFEIPYTATLNCLIAMYNECDPYAIKKIVIVYYTKEKSLFHKADI